jgi:hypothetical protein
MGGALVLVELCLFGVHLCPRSWLSDGGGGVWELEGVSKFWVGP